LSTLFGSILSPIKKEDKIGPEFLG